MANILVTGGAGFIGAHTCEALVRAGYNPIVYDNLSNANPIVMDRLEQITGQRPPLIAADIRDGAQLDAVFASFPIAAVIHFAGVKAVGESVAKPLMYYDVNVSGTLSLLAAMERASVRTLIFSSTATVYGEPASVPVTEVFSLNPMSPYASSKLMVETILGDLVRAQSEWRVARLRYFNPVGAHESGLIGEDPQGIPNNLVPYIAQVAVGRRDHLTVFGDDYNTPDGTGVRDYIHVVDLAEGHIAALDYLRRESGCLTLNLGTGQGASVLDVVKAFERASGRPIPYRIAGRRPGDVAIYFADPSQAEKLLNWKATRSIDIMCADVWRWQSHNPHGYADPR